jgi:hypothetical protein
MIGIGAAFRFDKSKRAAFQRAARRALPKF